MKHRPIFHMALAVIFAVATSCSGTDHDAEADGTITLDDVAETVILDAEPREAVRIGLSCDSDWSILPSSSWLVVTPVSGKGTPGRTIYITAYVNSKAEERRGTVTVSSATDRRIIQVIQLPEGCEAPLNVSLPEGTRDVSVDGALIELKVFSRTPWTLDAPEWAAASMASGEAYATATVSITIGQNTGDSVRSGTVLLKTEGGEEYRLNLVQQYDKYRNMLASWTLGDDAFMSRWNESNSNSWTGYGSVIADKPEGTGATMVWHQGTDETERTFIISSDGAGHWAVKPTWQDDNFQFSVPLTAVSAGDSVLLRTAIQSNVTSVPRDWAVEHLSSGTWVKDADYRISAIKTACNVECGWRLTDEMIVDGSLQVRLRCNGTVNIGGGTLTAPAAGSAVRIVPHTLDGDSGNTVFMVIR